MKKTSIYLLALGAFAVAGQVQATTIFSDNFNSENGGDAFLNYGTPGQNGSGGTGGTTYNTSFANWTVTAGSVDIIGWTAPFAPGKQGAGAPSSTSGAPDYDFLPGNGLYVDLDGTMGTGPAPAGTITSTALALAAGNYVLSFSLAGSQRGETKDTQITVATGVASETITLGPTIGFSTYTLDFTLASPQSVNLVFSDTDTADQFGALLDNVELNSVSAPDGGTTAMLLGMGVIALVAFRRKFNSKTA